jgi:hypothetical protein
MFEIRQTPRMTVLICAALIAALPLCVRGDPSLNEYDQLKAEMPACAVVPVPDLNNLPLIRVSIPSDVHWVPSAFVEKIDNRAFTTIDDDLRAALRHGPAKTMIPAGAKGFLFAVSKSREYVLFVTSDERITREKPTMAAWIGAASYEPYCPRPK